ncbi:class II fumarate hydratase [Aliiglaciecola sp. LCG003]|uniref:class II fumarate hydratase n=1 Tax=Aliiglaciecola sp. LCG003 TaxID=3053655 RepID=UPI0025745F6D|nr:class II fumarate hydratase [Aliiglaciecola sp. LCG003]WJG09411.1 class II fumarate hydratase [Aliiglaciecola sp. LCG003]
MASPQDNLFAKQTQNALDNFKISNLTMPVAFIHALGEVKSACAKANKALGLLDDKIANSIIAAAERIAGGEFDQQFPIDVFQTGSGTSTNMNANEVIAQLASCDLGQPVHPNDHVNMGQSSNDIIPSCIHISAVKTLSNQLLPTVTHLVDVIDHKAVEYATLVKTGRTHLMDAMPISVAQELGGWSAQLRAGISRISETLPRVCQLAVGGTAVGTGINTHVEFSQKVCSHLSKQTGLPFTPAVNFFAAISSQDAAVELSGQLKTLAVSLMKISNDLRWMNSGPNSGLGEIVLTKLQAGSSIMPGKVNPVIPEATAMACAQVMGNDATISIAGQSGNFQLNTMLPVIAYNLLQSIEILAGSCTALADKAIHDMQFNRNKLEQAVSRNPILVTALNSIVGYDKGAEIATCAYKQGRPILDVAKEMTDLSEQQLTELLDPRTMI